MRTENQTLKEQNNTIRIEAEQNKKVKMEAVEVEVMKAQNKTLLEDNIILTKLNRQIKADMASKSASDDVDILKAELHLLKLKLAKAENMAKEAAKIARGSSWRRNEKSLARCFISSSGALIFSVLAGTV